MFDITAAVQQKNFYLLVSVHHCAIQRRWVLGGWGSLLVAQFPGRKKMVIFLGIYKKKEEQFQ
jgi:hypothetical protein